MLPRDRAARIITVHVAVWSLRAIADQLGHAPQTVRGYLDGRTIPGVRAQRPSLLTELLAGYCRKRFAEDPYLRPSTLFSEVIELGFNGSRSTFYRELRQGRLSPPGHQQSVAQQEPPQDFAISRTFVHEPAHITELPRRVAPTTGEALVSYLTRLAHANGLTISETLAVLPPWFTTKINNPDDRAQHHMLAPATAEALRALAHLTSTTETGPARALPAFASPDTHHPLRATTACHRCAARRGIHQPIPVHLPIHHKICTRHGIWLTDAGQSSLDVVACPEIITAQQRVNRLLRRHTPTTDARPAGRDQRYPCLANVASRHRAPLEISAPHTANHQPPPRHTSRPRLLYTRGDLPRRHKPRHNDPQQRTEAAIQRVASRS